MTFCLGVYHAKDGTWAFCGKPEEMHRERWGHDFKRTVEDDCSERNGCGHVHTPPPEAIAANETEG